MPELYRTERFISWHRRMRNRTAKARIAYHFDRVAHEGVMLGDIRPIGEDVFEVRFHFGAGYRAYYTHLGSTIVLLLLGGDKSTQERDIREAKAMAREWRDHA